MEIQMSNNYTAIIPDRAIVVNFGDAERSQMCFEVDVQGAETEYPQFIVFANGEEGTDLKWDTVTLYQIICGICPGFSKALAMRTNVFKDLEGHFIGIDDNPVWLGLKPLYDLTNSGVRSEEDARRMFCWGKANEDFAFIIKREHED